MTAAVNSLAPGGGFGAMFNSFADGKCSEQHEGISASVEYMSEVNGVVPGEQLLA